MHIVVSVVCGFIAWLALLALVAIADGPGAVLWPLIAGPLVVSGVILVLTVGELVWFGSRWMWRNRSTFR